MAGDLRIVLDRPGRSSLELTPLPTSLTWVTAAVGGFADCSFQIPGDRRRDLPLVSLARVMWGDEILYEGIIEDYRLELSDTGFVTTVDCYGLRRRLEQTSVRRVYVKRDLNWAALTISAGAQIFSGSGISIANSENAGQISNGSIIGAYDTSDLTKIGVRLVSNSGIGVGAGQAVEMILPSVTIMAILGTLLASGAWDGVVGSSNGGTTWEAKNHSNGGAGGDFNHACVTGTDRIRLAQYNNTAAGFPNTDFSSLRLLGATTSEDVAGGGLYGGTILRDLIALVPELTVGTIEAGSDFALDQIDRSVRDSALSVVEEVSGYYSRAYAVWEGGRFDWKTHNLDEPQWMVSLRDLDGLALQSSIDSLVRTIYLSYVSAIDLTSKEVTASSTDQRNPYVKRGQTKDAVISAPFLMTPTTSQQLATVLARLQGGYPPVNGTIILPSNAVVSRNNFGKAPAYMIRGGDNILISDLPKSDPLMQGRDGETLFTVASSEVSMEDGTIKLEVESMEKRADLLLARLAAATRSVTG